MARTTHSNDINSDASVLYVSLELSKNTWKLGFTVGRAQKARIRDVAARDRTGFAVEVANAKKRFGLAPEALVRTCYEAGRDGFWIHRWLASEGIENVIIDAASIEVTRRHRRVKTDRVDAQKLVSLLVRHHEGEDVFRVVRVPPLEAEDER